MPTLRAFQCHYHSWRFIETECLTCLTKVCICLQSLRCYREVGGLGVGESGKNGGGGVGEKQSQTRPKWTQTLPERGNVCECGCVQSNSANIVLQFTIDMVICVNSDFQQHHMESQMCSQQWPYQDKFWFPLCPAAIPPLLLFLFPYPHPLPSVLSLSLSCLCFACRSEVSRGCCIHFQFPLCGGIPLVITFSFPTLAPCAKFSNSGLSLARQWPDTESPLGHHLALDLFHHKNVTYTYANKAAKTACVSLTAHKCSVLLIVALKQCTHFQLTHLASC